MDCNCQRCCAAFEVTWKLLKDNSREEHEGQGGKMGSVVPYRVAPGRTRDGERLGHVPGSYRLFRGVWAANRARAAGVSKVAAVGSCHRFQTLTSVAEQDAWITDPFWYWKGCCIFCRDRAK